MKIKVRPLNHGETFCCSIKAAKKFFKDSEVFLDFACLERHFSTFARTPDRFYIERNVKGVIIAAMYMYSRELSPIFSFHVLKESNFSEKMKEEFETKYLPEFYRLYTTMLQDSNLIRTEKLMLVELKESKMKLYETILN